MGILEELQPGDPVMVRGVQSADGEWNWHWREAVVNRASDGQTLEAGGLLFTIKTGARVTGHRRTTGRQDVMPLADYLRERAEGTAGKALWALAPLFPDDSYELDDRLAPLSEDQLLKVARLARELAELLGLEVLGASEEGP